jgi:hypothetical protein
VPPKISIIDLIAAVTGTVNPLGSWTNLSKRFAKEEIRLSCCFAKFPGQGQSETPVTDARGVVTIINRLNGSHAGKFHEKFADTLVRYLCGDETLIGKIRSICEAQEQLPKDHPIRVFGQTVEAERGVNPDPAADLQHALKRQRIQNELDEEIERGKRIKTEEERRVRAIKLQNSRETLVAKGEIFEILFAGGASALAAPPALLGMLNAARHNFALQALAQLTVLSSDVAFSPHECPPVPQTPVAQAVTAAPAATAQRVTVLEVGRDVLRLRPDHLTSSHLSKVGLVVGKTWLSTRTARTSGSAPSRPTWL